MESGKIWCGDVLVLQQREQTSTGLGTITATHRRLDNRTKLGYAALWGG